MSQTQRLFGTDGIRGTFGVPPLDEETVRRVARAIVTVLRENGAHPPHLLIGGDTRESTPQLTQWLGSSFGDLDCRVTYLGTLPTPGVAHLVRTSGASAGIIVSASHNPYRDNGIKLIGSDGFKFSDAWERRVEELATTGRPAGEAGAPSPAAPALLESYREHLVASAGARLDSLEVILDTGHGAASALAGDVFERLGARTAVLHDQPNGRNINDRCGSTAPELVARAVSRSGADLGFAFDGDADRVIVVDANGVARDGDEILYLWATELAANEALQPAMIVATSMSNLGLERSLAPHGISVCRCDVGDREVVRTLREKSLKLGGEQSGHIINLDLATTGDGLLTAIQIAAIVARRGEPLEKLLAHFTRFPQLLRNVRVKQKPPLLEIDAVRQKSEQIEERLGTNGRLVLRYSGTEPLARVMIEGPDREEIEALATELAQVIEQALG